jgi:phosphoribosylaminoimidazole carboxylase (NCAIR synthetase)
VILKTPRGGYDGKGVFVVHGPQVVADLLERHGTLLAEERVAMTRELSAQVARSPFGQVAVWPIVETVQDDGVCCEVLAPAPGLSEARATAAQELAVRIAYSVGVVVATLALFAIPLALGADLQSTLLRSITFMVVGSPCSALPDRWWRRRRT